MLLLLVMYCTYTVGCSGTFAPTLWVEFYLLLMLYCFLCYFCDCFSCSLFVPFVVVVVAAAAVVCCRRLVPFVAVAAALVAAVVVCC